MKFDPTVKGNPDLVVDGHRRWATLSYGAATVTMRFPLHILQMSEDDAIWHIQQVQKALQKKLEKLVRQGRHLV